MHVECCVCVYAICSSQHFDLRREFPGDKAEYLKVREAASGGVFVVSGGGEGEGERDWESYVCMYFGYLVCLHDLYCHD